MSATRKPKEPKKFNVDPSRIGNFAPTNDDNVSDKPTMSDNVSYTPTTDYERELVQATVRLARWQKKQLQVIADRDGRLLSDVVREAVRQYLKGGR